MLGGLISYAALRKKHRSRATRTLLVGFGIFAIQVLIAVGATAVIMGPQSDMPSQTSTMPNLEEKDSMDHEAEPDPVYKYHGRGWDTDHHIILFSHAKNGDCGHDDSGPCLDHRVRNYHELRDIYDQLDLIIAKRWPDRSIYVGETVEWDYVHMLDGLPVPPITVTDTDGSPTKVDLGASDNRIDSLNIARVHTFGTAGTYTWQMDDFPHIKGTITVLPNSDGLQTSQPEDEDMSVQESKEDTSPNASQKVEPSAQYGTNAKRTDAGKPTTVTAENSGHAAHEFIAGSGGFVFHWESDEDSISGYEYSSGVNEPLEVRFLDSGITIPDHSSALTLQHDYGILLSDEDSPWSGEHAFALVETLKRIPQDARDYYSDQNLDTSKWILRPDHIEDDIKITHEGQQKVVEISVHAFDNANPKVAEIDGKQGRYFSQRLHHALVLYVTDYGRDSGAVERVLERYGVSAKIDDYAELTRNTTDESRESFQEFHPMELVMIINMFEEMPPGFHSVDGLDNIVRRADGTVHPVHTSAPAVAWIESGYIEFMETAFTSNDQAVYRLILHEKAHFLWHWIFSESLRQDWTKLGGWYQDADSVWHTDKTTEFVSSYAHLKNPDEDMAESISYFIMNPDKLKSRSLEKYEFVRDRIMQGNIYISKIREDLTFDVYNLYPDYIYPGKIVSVDVQVMGRPQDDKTLTVQIGLAAEDSFEGAEHAYMRIFSESGTFVDMYLHPLDESGSVLRGEITLDRTVKDGNWYVNQIVVTDIHGNQRFEGQNDFGWMMYVDNPGQDTVPPRYVMGTLEMAVAQDLQTYPRPVQIVTVSWEVDEDQSMNSCFARIDHESDHTYSIDEYGDFDASTGRCNVDFVITEYHVSGKYLVTMLKMEDEAENNTYLLKSDLVGNAVRVATGNQDTVPPYLDINSIDIRAEPTNPEMPNGETLVEISYFASDDKSGLDMVSYVLVDPQGTEHFEYHYHKNYYTMFFEGDPTELVEYEIRTVLPEGSPPGKWGLAKMTLADKATNKKFYGFAETIHFVVDG